MISTSEERAEHPLAGRNTQHLATSSQHNLRVDAHDYKQKSIY